MAVTGKVETFKAKWFEEPRSVVAEVTALIDSGCDGGDGEFDALCDELVMARWPTTTEWECTQVSCFPPTGRVILHDLRVVSYVVVTL